MHVDQDEFYIDSLPQGPRRERGWKALSSLLFGPVNVMSTIHALHALFVKGLLSRICLEKPSVGLSF